jgi:hypothetical protein
MCLEIVIVSIMPKDFQIENSKYCTINYSFGLFVRYPWSELMKFSLFLTNIKSIIYNIIIKFLFCIRIFVFCINCLFCILYKDSVRPFIDSTPRHDTNLKPLSLEPL